MNPEEQPTAGQNPVNNPPLTNPAQPSAPEPTAPPAATPPPVPPVVPPAPNPVPPTAPGSVPAAPAPPSGSVPPPGAPVAAGAASTAGPWPGSLHIISEAIQGILANPIPAAIYVAVSLVLGLLAMALHFSAGVDARTAAADVSSLGALILIRAVVVYNLSIADKRPLSLGQFFEINVKQFIFLIIAAISVTVLFFLSVFTLFIALLWLIPWFAVTAYVLVDKDLTPFAAMGESRRLGRNHRGKVLALFGWMILLSLLVSVLGAIPYTLYVTQPIVVIIEGASLAITYRWLQRNVATA